MDATVVHNENVAPLQDTSLDEMGDEVCEHCSVCRHIGHDKLDMLVNVRLDAAHSKDIPSVFAVGVHLMDGHLAGDNILSHLPINVNLFHRFFICEDEPRRITEE